MKYETLIRNCFRAWQTRDWDLLEKSLAEGFTFTSLYDEHIGIAEFKQKCWEAVREIEPYELVSMMEKGDEAFVRYRCRINGEPVQNIEHYLFQAGKIKEINVFFGRPADSSSSNA